MTHFVPPVKAKHHLHRPRRHLLYIFNGCEPQGQEFRGTINISQLGEMSCLFMSLDLQDQLESDSEEQLVPQDQLVYRDQLVVPDPLACEEPLVLRDLA